MKESEYRVVKDKVDKLIKFVNWRGAPLENRRMKIIKELSIIEKYCKRCVNDKNSDTGRKSN